jgi:hypothetical protein
MIKNRTFQIIYLTIYCTIGLLALLASVGFFEYYFKWDFYVYFTNLSNYYCLLIVFIELIQTIRKKKDDYITTLPRGKFVGMMSILLTFIIFNFILGPGRSSKDNFSFESLSLHFILPIMYLLDWFLFYRRKKMNWKYPLFALSFPAGYLIFIILHAMILNFDTSIISLNGYSPLIYPYFFIDFSKQGIDGVLIWSGYIAIALVIFGYIFYLIDKISFKRSNYEKD